MIVGLQADHRIAERTDHGVEIGKSLARAELARRTVLHRLPSVVRTPLKLAQRAVNDRLLVGIGPDRNRRIGPADQRQVDVLVVDSLAQVERLACLQLRGGVADRSPRLALCAILLIASRSGIDKPGWSRRG